MDELIVQRALKESFREVVRQHKLHKCPLVFGEDGRVIHVCYSRIDLYLLEKNLRGVEL